jgi:hypothetical protein
MASLSDELGVKNMSLSSPPSQSAAAPVTLQNGKFVFGKKRQRSREAAKKTFQAVRNLQERYGVQYGLLDKVVKLHSISTVCHELHNMILALSLI